MFNNRQKAIMVKDVRGITENKRYFSVLTILPLIFSVVFPTIMLLTVLLSPTDSSSFTEMARILPDFQKLDQEQLIRDLLSLMINNVIPIFFLIIPIMTASVMAASSFVGEKEKRTLETLLYSPLSIMPIALLLIGQFTGILVFGGWVVISIGLILLLIALLLLRFSMTGFTYERLLER